MALALLKTTMKNIADHILDIAENSVRAEAQKVEVFLSVNEESGQMKLSFVDDGVGMSEEVIDKIKNPFFSTRKTRRIGMGIPLLMQNSEMCGGRVTISSKEGEGTIVVATFDYHNLDCPPLGDVADAIYFLSSQHLGIRFVFDYIFNDTSYRWDTNEVQDALDGLPLNAPEVKDALMELLRSNMGE